ncbi:MAG: fluoride efflux transporter CrcB [Muribaculaceae bacterium]|nr:fluoride efflux transporter CrcB [Muribaculaceae bacterium]
MNWINIAIVFIGSGLGGVCRYIVSRIVQEQVPGALFPWGTFAVNVIGCFLIGLFYGIFDRHTGPALSPQLRLMLTVGFCGGFTTFSTFINENFLLFQSSSLLIVLAYIALSVLAGFILLYAGYVIALHVQV